MSRDDYRARKAKAKAIIAGESDDPKK